MKCPYCAEDIKDEAIACRYCNRDFFVIQPLMEKLKTANARIKVLERTLHNAGVDPESKGREAAAAKQKVFVADNAAVVVAVVDDAIPTVAVWATVLVTFLTLVVAHYVIVILLDLSLIYLRIVSIAVPLVMGFLYRKSLDRWLFWDLGTGLAIAAASILVMSVVVAKTDHVPVLPQDAQGLREYAEYMASIGFGFFTGCVFRHGLMVARAPSPKVSYLVELASRYIAKKIKKGDDDESPKDEIDAQVKKIESLVSGAIAAGSVAISIYTGLKGFMT